MPAPMVRYVVMTFNYDGSPMGASLVQGFEGAWQQTAQARQTQAGVGGGAWQIYTFKDGKLSLFLDQDGPA